MTPGTRVRVTFPGNDWHDPDTVIGTVTARDHDSIEVTNDDGDTWTLFDRQPVVVEAL